MSSVRLEFSVDSLREQITARRDRQVTNAKAEYDRVIDLPARREAWRTEQEKRVRSLARRLKTVPDNELASFKIPSCPSLDSYRTPEQTRDREIADAQASYAANIRRLEGLRARDGVLSLTPSMLRDWFGL